MSVLVASLLLLASPSPQYYGVYFLGHKMGYRKDEVGPDQVDGQAAIRMESRTIVTFKNLGASVQRSLDGTTWTTPDNHPIRDHNVTRSGKQISTYDTKFGPKTAEVDIDTDGKKSHKSVPIPDGPIYEDLYRVIHEKCPQAGQSFTCWTFASGDDAFSKVELKTVGPSTFQADGKAVPGILTEMKNRGNRLRIYLAEDGSFLRQEWASGILETVEPEAMAMQPPKEPPPDLTLLSLLKPDRRIDNVLTLKQMKLRITGFDLSNMPSDDVQSVEKDGDGWTVEVHPPLIEESTGSIADAKASQPDWIRPADDIPSDNPQMVTLAAGLVKKSKNVKEAASAILRYVHGIMTDDYGFGIDRDAMEILHDRRGKCTDYAVLTTTLMRAAGIPSRIASGLLVTPTGLQPNYIVYHSWCEIWDGRRWLGIDSTMPRPQMTAAHLKLVEGNAEDGLAIIPADPGEVGIQVLSYPLPLSR